MHEVHDRTMYKAPFHSMCLRLKCAMNTIAADSFAQRKSLSAVIFDIERTTYLRKTILSFSTPVIAMCIR